MDLHSELYPAFQQADRGECMTIEQSRESLRRELPIRMAELDAVVKGNLPLPE